MSAQNFNFAPKLPQNRYFQPSIFIFAGKLADRLNLGYCPPPPVTTPLGEVVPASVLLLLPSSPCINFGTSAPSRM